jgi:dCMP deaminase
MIRPTIDKYFLDMSILASSRGTCKRRKVGCILVSIDNQVLSTGYNGVPSGFEHCIDNPCEGANYASGEGLDKCEAIHAEMNAVINCRDIKQIHTAYCTDSPCIHCIKVLLNTPCNRIVSVKKYAHNDKSHDLWLKSGRKWHIIENN